jgi:uncharacterized protein involved in exopolysaccharide biosynthesis
MSAPSPSGPGGGSSPGTGEEATLNFSSILTTLMRGKWIILITCIAVAGSVAAYTYTLPSVYEASSMVRLAPPADGARSISNVSSRDITSEIGVLRNSVELAQNVAEKLRATDEADGGASTFPILVNDQTGESLTAHKVARRILEQTSFSPSGEQRFIRITVESKVPEEASTIANLYADAYKRFSMENARSSMKAAREFLETQADKQREEINQLEQRLASFTRENDLVVQGSDGQRLVQEYQRLNSRRDRLAFDLKKEKTQLELLRQQLRQFQPRLEESVMENQETTSTRREIGALEEQIAKMRAEAARYYAVNPDLEGDTTRIQNEFPELAGLIQDMEALQDRRRRLTQQLITETARQAPSNGSGAPMERVAQLRTRITEKEVSVNLLESQVAALDSQITNFEPRLDQIPQQRIERNQIDRKLNQAESFYQTIIRELQRTAVAEESEL